MLDPMHISSPRKYGRKRKLFHSPSKARARKFSRGRRGNKIARSYIPKQVFSSASSKTFIPAHCRRKFVCKLAASSISLTSSDAKAVTVRCNDPHSPTGTGTSIQPPGWDQFKQWYKRYVISGSQVIFKISCYAEPNSDLALLDTVIPHAPMRAGVLVQDTDTFSGSTPIIEKRMLLPRQKTREIMPTAHPCIVNRDTSGTTVHMLNIPKWRNFKLKKGFSWKQEFGAKPFDEDNYTLTSTSPAADKLKYFVLWLQNDYALAATHTNIDVHVETYIKYTCHFFEPKEDFVDDAAE